MRSVIQKPDDHEEQEDEEIMEEEEEEDEHMASDVSVEVVSYEGSNASEHRSGSERSHNSVSGTPPSHGES